ncbi:MAG: hypothetical protein EBQ92_12770 [Proteobacteria bacterium]|nr:hypothetical protein [Pseudomonadota bacterium]
MTLTPPIILCKILYSDEEKIILYKNLLEDSKKEIQTLKSELSKEREENKELQRQIIRPFEPAAVTRRHILKYA